MVAKHSGEEERHEREILEESPFLHPDEAADYLRITRRALENFRVTGKGPAYRKHGGRIVYHIEDLDEWSQHRRYRSPSDKDDA
jgi:molybdenum cofactor biosynthesis enzyme MoaA